ncbi:oxygen-insensitive NAD(P)H nitroreductase [Pseudomonas sp. TCU-HL1]|uniref:oxygen-insensitive NAD(P)H nitroreductase n=1 Tax=Pseudomonas sp. TCU-HL1 TaxID=1856685 RepID=UPI00083D09D3|nr:oxygen-insensitive NAD(P)H nitroreductase [Pseudomonas sp. TCU-HL1]AOE85148.1 dihydropteridine reductase [Pseudomonas sp. TCU-HL1]
MNPASLASQRYTTKAYDPSQRVPQATIDELLVLLRQAPSSVNSQPWHFVVARTDEGKARLAKGTQGAYAYNQPKVMDASHVILICARTDMTDAHLTQVLKQEEQDGRFRDGEARAGQDRTRQGYVNLHRYERKDLQHWMEKQAYLALGTLLLGAAALGVDATPMEGFDPQQLDVELGLREQGYTSVVLVALGRRSEKDFNAALPKSRLPAECVITTL